MFYEWAFMLPFGETEATRERFVLELEKGTVIRCEVVFPVGCCNLVYVHIDDAIHQVYPKDSAYGRLNLHARLRGNGCVITSNDEYEIKEEPYTLQFYGWNTDEKYNHTITVRIQLVPAKEILHRVVGEVMRITKLSRPTV